MRLIKIFSQGTVLNEHAYDSLRMLDQHIVFPGCNNEFQKNREWWVMQDVSGMIIAYCGCLLSQGVCIFVRAWVHSSVRGKGLQRKMIKARIKTAKETCQVAITYTTKDNIASINNLIKEGFLIYIPQEKYSGTEVLYWRRQL